MTGMPIEIEPMECSFGSGHPLHGYSVLAQAGATEGLVRVEFRSPEMECKLLIKSAGLAAIESLVASLNFAGAIASWPNKSAIEGFKKLFSDAVDSPDLNEFEAQRTNKKGADVK